MRRLPFNYPKMKYRARKRKVVESGFHLVSYFQFKQVPVKRRRKVVGRKWVLDGEYRLTA